MSERRTGGGLGDHVQIEIDLSKLERGTRVGRVKVTRGGKTFYRRQRVGVKEVEEKVDNLKIIQKTIPNVDLPGLSEDQLNSLAIATKNVLEKFGAKIDTIRWSNEKMDGENWEEMGGAYVGKDPNNITIVLGKKNITNPNKFLDKLNNYYNNKINNQIKEETIRLEYAETLEDKLRAKSELKLLKTYKRFGVYNDSKDPIRSLFVHEFLHVVDEENNFTRGDLMLEEGEEEGLFRIALNKYNVSALDEASVSWYAHYLVKELWAETGTALDIGLQIPKSLKLAFEETYRKFKMEIGDKNEQR